MNDWLFFIGIVLIGIAVACFGIVLIGIAVACRVAHVRKSFYDIENTQPTSETCCQQNTRRQTAGPSESTQGSAKCPTGSAAAASQKDSTTAARFENTSA